MIRFWMVTQDMPIKAARLTGYDRITENMTNHLKSSALQTAAERKNTTNIFIKIYLGEKLYRHIFILSFRTCK